MQTIECSTGTQAQQVRKTSRQHNVGFVGVQPRAELHRISLEFLSRQTVDEPIWQGLFDPQDALEIGQALVAEAESLLEQYPPIYDRDRLGFDPEKVGKEKA